MTRRDLSHENIQRQNVRIFNVIYGLAQGKAQVNDNIIVIILKRNRCSAVGCGAGTEGVGWRGWGLGYGNGGGGGAAGGREGRERGQSVF